MADRGPGRPDDKKDTIFDRFVQVDHDAARCSGGGMGLGFTLCQEIVQTHGGKITVEDREGGGSVFTVVLPSGEADRPAGGDAVQREGACPTVDEQCG